MSKPSTTECIRIRFELSASDRGPEGPATLTITTPASGASPASLLRAADELLSMLREHGWGGVPGAALHARVTIERQPSTGADTAQPAASVELDHLDPEPLHALPTTAALSPTEQLDDFFSGLADRLGARQPQGFTAHLEPADRATLNQLLQLVGTRQVDHTLNSSGDVLVPIEDGSWMLVLNRITLEGDWWVSAELPLRIELPPQTALSPETDRRIARFVADTDEYYGLKCVRYDDAIVLMQQVPLAGLQTDTLFAVLRRLAFVLREIEPQLAGMPGTAPPSVWHDRFPVTRSITADDDGVRTISPEAL